MEPTGADNDLGELRSEATLVGERLSRVHSDPEDSDWDSSFVSNSLPGSQYDDRSCNQARELLLEEVEKLQEEVVELERRVAERQKDLSVEDERLSAIMKATLLEGRTTFCEPMSQHDVTALPMSLVFDHGMVVADSFGAFEKATQQLELIQSITGVELKRVSQDVVREDESTCHWHHVLEAETNGIKFKADFLMKEEKTKEEEKPDGSAKSGQGKSWYRILTEPAGQHEQLPVIEELRVSLPPAIQDQMKEFLGSVEKERNLYQFLSTIVQFADWHRVRLQIFEKLMETYPELVQRPNPNSKSRITILAGPRLCFCFQWKPTVSPEGDLSSQFSFTCDHDSDVPLTDNLKSILSSLPEQFEQIVEIIGIENALTQVVQTVSKLSAGQ